MWNALSGLILFLAGIAALRVSVALESYSLLAAGVGAAMLGVLYALGSVRQPVSA